MKSFAASGVANKGYTLKLIGHCSDAYKQHLDSLAGESKFSIEYEGYQNDVYQYFASATAFLMCSQFEGLGRVTVEAMYHGCPVIARNSGGTTDFVIHEKTGYLFDTDEECARLIKNLAEGYDVAEVSANAKEMACRNFTKEVYGEKIMTIYKSVIEPNKM